jgi:uncharacterized caspase-like protein
MGKSSSYRDNAHAVIIGINQYEDKNIPDLKFARADAEAIHNVLSDPELGRISPDNIILLLDEQATQRKIRSAIGTKIPRRAGEKDVVYVYFAGHGAPVIDPRSGSKDGMEKYLVPVDAELEDLRASGISMEEIKKFFGWIDAKQIIFFIDSCYSGGVGGRTFQNPHYQTRAALTSEFLDDLASEGRVVISACDVNEVSLEISNMNHGLFTHYLLDGLRGRGDKDQDGLVTIDELYEYVFDNVSRHARKFGGSMRPVRKGSVTGKIYLTRYESEQQRQAKQVQAQAESAVSAGKFANALQLWRDILALDPDHDTARKEISRLKLVLRDQKQKAIEDLERGKKVLFKLFQDGQLAATDFNRAMTILKKDESNLTDRERITRGFLIHLIHGNFSAATYLESIAFLKDYAETVEDQQTSQPEAIRTDKKLQQVKIEKLRHKFAGKAPADKPSKPEPVRDSEPPVTGIPAEAHKQSEDVPKLVSAVSLRSTPAILTSHQQKKMLVENGFYDRYRNPHGHGFANHFESGKGGKVISDHASGLMWQQSGSGESIAHEHTQAYLDQLNEEKFAGFNDWRLPTLEEAMSLMEPKQKQSGLYSDAIFDNKQTGIWTADADKASRVWVTYFYNGNCGHYLFGSLNFVRAVRGI